MYLDGDNDRYCLACGHTEFTASRRDLAWEDAARMTAKQYSSLDRAPDGTKGLGAFAAG